MGCHLSISIIVPTIGRASLEQTLRSLTHQVQDEDEIIVVGDGERLSARRLCGPPIQYFETWRPGSRCGAEQRDYGIMRATGNWLAFLDDDDIYTRGALAAVRAQLPEIPDRPHIFRMQYEHRGGRILWDEPEFRICNVGTPMLVVPRRLDLPHWFRLDVRACFDWFWISQVVKLYTHLRDPILWHDAITCIVKPTEETAIAEIPVKE
jgi:glycosyltransferase involved in cell wall biosynthesis